MLKTYTRTYTLYYNNGNKTTVNTDNPNNYYTSDLNFYCEDDRFTWNKDLKKWETIIVF
jgi:hypothetical protein